MSKYIDADAEIDSLNDMKVQGETFITAVAFAKNILKGAPLADVVGVIRCKDCKHHEELLNNNDGNVICWVHDIDVIVDRNGYCNYGERKEQEHDR